jgi:hypothetical protein
VGREDHRRISRGNGGVEELTKGVFGCNGHGEGSDIEVQDIFACAQSGVQRNGWRISRIGRHKDHVCAALAGDCPECLEGGAEDLGSRACLAATGMPTYTVAEQCSRQDRRQEEVMGQIDTKTQAELEAAAFRRLVEHLRNRTDVQNIDLMNLAGFCRNCLANWMQDAAAARGIAMSKDEAREGVYGMPYEEWRQRHQKEASTAQRSAFDKAGGGHGH